LPRQYRKGCPDRTGFQPLTHGSALDFVHLARSKVACLSETTPKMKNILPVLLASIAGLASTAVLNSSSSPSKHVVARDGRDLRVGMFSLSEEVECNHIALDGDELSCPMASASKVFSSDSSTKPMHERRVWTILFSTLSRGRTRVKEPAD
jgi:hypothetical protein